MLKKHFIVSLSAQTPQCSRCPLSQGSSLPQQHSWHSRTGVMWQGVERGRAECVGLVLLRKWKRVFIGTYFREAGIW